MTENNEEVRVGIMTEWEVGDNFNLRIFIGDWYAVIYWLLSCKCKVVAATQVVGPL